MAKKKDNTLVLLLGVVGLGAVAFSILNKRKAPTQTNQAELAAQQPTARTQQWILWAQLALRTFGNVQELFEPGGIFFRQENDLSEFIDWVPGNDPNYNPNDDPYFVPGGWA